MSNRLLNICKALKQQNQKALAVLIDPDKMQGESLRNFIVNAEQAKVNFYFVGGSLMTQGEVSHCIEQIKLISKKPVILFPGSVSQVNEQADGILFLSLISGRNPDLLIGQHVVAAPLLKKMDIEVLPTGYMLIDGGQPTTVSYISQTQPIPHDKPEIATCTAMAGELLGLKLLYMDAGSGAKKAINPIMIEQVSKQTSLPLIIGGGIKSPKQAVNAAQAGADIIVIGTAFENEPDLIFEMAEAIKNVNTINV